MQVPADLRIIASSIQMLAHEKGMENWGNTPHELERLVGLLKKYKADHTFAISGDVHFAELSKREVEGYPFYDFTSSGMSHTSKRWAEYTNSFRVGDASSEQNAGLIEIDWLQVRNTGMLLAPYMCIPQAVHSTAACCVYECACECECEWEWECSR